MVYRIATSEKFSDSLYEIETHWSLVDLLEAHLILNALEDAESKQMKKMETPTR